MGTDLIIISNHQLDYSDFDFDQLGQAVAARLNQTRLAHPELYWLTQEYWHKAEPCRNRGGEDLARWQHQADNFRREAFYGTDWRRGCLEFSGPFGWEVEVWPGKAEFHLWYFRYWGWVQPNSLYAKPAAREAHRQVLALLVRSLGGSEAVYLADNSHPLDGYGEPEYYVAIRQNLQQAFGSPLTSFAQMEAWQDQQKSGDKSSDQTYLVDNFSDVR